MKHGVRCGIKDLWTVIVLIVYIITLLIILTCVMLNHHMFEIMAYKSVLMINPSLESISLLKKTDFIQ